MHHTLAKFVSAVITVAFAFLVWNPSFPSLLFSSLTMSKEQKLLDYVLASPRLDSVRGSPEGVLSIMDEYIKDHHFMVIGKYKGDLIRSNLKQSPPDVMIELGCYVGYLAILFAGELVKHHPAEIKVKYYSFEFSADYAAIARQLVDLAGLSSVVEIIVGPAGKSLPDFAQRPEIAHGGTLGAVFIDHAKDYYVPDLRVLESLGLIGPGTTIFADNIYRPGVPEYVAYVQGDPQYRKEHNKEHPNPNDPIYEGRWNILYESKTYPVTNPENGFADAVEITHVLEYLSG